MTSGFQAAFAAEAKKVRTKSSLNDALTNTPIRTQISEIRTRERQEMDVVRGQASLSELGKRQMIARVWLNVDATITKLAAADLETKRARYDELEKAVFGIGDGSDSSSISFRDAVERARALKGPDDALELLGSASLSSDDILAKAIVMRAWSKGWTSIVDAYAGAHPGVADKLTELQAIAQWRDSNTSKLGGAMGATHHKPTELADLNLKAITSLAEADLPRLKPGDAEYWWQNNVYTGAEVNRVFGRNGL